MNRNCPWNKNISRGRIILIVLNFAAGGGLGFYYKETGAAPHKSPRPLRTFAPYRSGPGSTPASLRLLPHGWTRVLPGLESLGTNSAQNCDAGRLGHTVTSLHYACHGGRGGDLGGEMVKLRRRPGGGPLWRDSDGQFHKTELAKARFYACRGAMNAVPGPPQGRGAVGPRCRSSRGRLPAGPGPGRRH
jgi:hypothetical protein